MRKITQERLKNIAFYYLERYDASSYKLRSVLKRRLIKASLEQIIPKEANLWIENVIQEMKKLGYINDKRYAENTIRRLSEMGKSRSFIRTKLKLAGIEEEEIKALLSDTDELSSARLLIQKKHLGHDFKRDLARLARAGYSYEIAREALEEISYSEEDF